MADNDGVVQLRNSQTALVSTETHKRSQPKKIALDEDDFTDVSCPYWFLMLYASKRESILNLDGSFILTVHPGSKCERLH